MSALESILSLRGYEWWIVATAAAANVACAVPGCFLMLRRQALLGDAISHAILPGIVAAFLLTGSRDVPAMLAGAGVVGVLTALLSGALTRTGRVHDDAAMGVVFTSLFALGVVLMAWVPATVDLDAGCVLYGAVEFVHHRSVVVGGVEAPAALLWLAGAAALNALLAGAFFKELRIVAFDPAAAAAMGISVPLVHYGLVSVVAGTSVVAFEAVGSVLVVAMLIVPAATAHLLTDRLPRMLALAAGVGAISALAGFVLSVRLNTSAAGMMCVCAGAMFALAVLLAPRHGLVTARVRRWRLSGRIVREDVLGLLYRWHERASAGSPGLRPGHVATALAAPWTTAWAVWSLRRDGSIHQRGDGTLTLSDAGRARAAGLVRSHRLWELYLARHLGLPIDHLHAPSHRVEHFISPEMQRGLAAELGGDAAARADPHGREIPRG